MKLYRRMRWTTIAHERLRRLAARGLSAKDIGTQLRTTEAEVLLKARLEGIGLGRRVRRRRSWSPPFN